MIRGAKKILVINLRYIGDSIWTIPFMRNLKMNMPDSEISVLINEGGEIFLRLMPEVSEVLTVRRSEIKGRLGILNFIRLLIRVRKKHFDTAIVLSNSDRPTIIAFASGAKRRIGFVSDSWWRDFLLTDRFRWDNDKNPHMIEFYLQALVDSGLKIYNRDLKIDVPGDVINGIIKRFGVLKTKDKKSLIVHPGARNELRQWGADNFAEVINSLSGRYRIFLIGGPSERRIVQAILNRLKKMPDIVSTDLSLLEFAALCKLSDLFVGNDSAPIHIAAAAGLYVVGIYGPTLSKHCGPWTDKKIVFDISTVPCRPCRQDKCINQEEKACMNIIQPDMVISKIEKAFEYGLAEPSSKTFWDQHIKPEG